MAVFDTLIDEIAAKFGLGSNAGPLVREILNFVANAPGGIKGFLSRLESAGLRSEVGSWLGNSNAAPLPGNELDRALGSGLLGGLANRFGISETVAKSAVGYALPKLIGALTPGGRIPTSLPSEVEGFLSSSRVSEPGARRVSSERFTERAADVSSDVNPNQPGLPRWTWPALGAAAVLALALGIFNRAHETPVTAQANNPVRATAENRTTAEGRAPAVATNTASAQNGAIVVLTEEQARAWVDKPVFSSEGKRLGEVRALLRTPDNKVSELHADIGGYLGIGEHRIRIEPAQFNFNGDRVVLDLTATQAGELPKIQK